MADQPHIKPEPEAEGASPMVMEDDMYEDAGDLEFYDATEPSDPYGTMYLARVPPYIWAAWSKIDEDAEIPIGTIRQWQDPSGKHRFRLLLNQGRAEHQALPKEYELDITEPSVKNTFMFTEQDLPGFASKNKARADAAAAGIPSHLLRQKVVDKPAQDEQQQPQHRGRRRGPYYRKAIPKKTRVAGRIRHELACNPAPLPDNEHILQKRAVAAMLPKNQTMIADEVNGGGNIIHAGTNQAFEKFGTFIKTAPPEKTKARKMELKTARMPENELLDRIFQCFNRYKYWSMRALRAEIPQPEIYLRTTLERIADLHKSGRFANQWSLKPENIRTNSAAAGAVGEAAPEVAAADDEDGADEEEDIKMEDVVPS